MKSILTFFKVMVILFWIGFFMTIGAFIFFGDQIIAFFYTIPLLVQIKETFGITRDTLETLIVFLIVIMLPITLMIFSLSSRMSAHKKESKSIGAPIVQAKPLVSQPVPVQAVGKTKKEKKAKPVKETKVKVEKDYYELGLTGIRIKK